MTRNEALSLPPVERVTSRRKPKRNVNDQHEATLSGMERLAIWITDNIGTMGFFLIILFWTLAWMGWNLLAQREHLRPIFDRPWEFAIWLFISNLIQIHLMPLIMVGQNLQSRHAELRAEQEFHITQQTEQEMEVVLRYLETMQQTLTHLDERLQALEQQTARVR